MSFKSPLFFILFFFVTIGYGQYEHLFHKPYHEKADQLGRMYESILSVKNLDSAYRIMDDIKEQAVKKRDMEMQMEIHLLKAYYNCFYDLRQESDLIAELEEISKTAEKKGMPHIQARALNTAQWYYRYRVGNYELASDYLLELDRIITNMEDESFPDKADCLNSIGSCYQFFGDYRKAIGYFLRAIRLKETSFNARMVTAAMNNLGVCYQELGMLDSSDYYFHKILQKKNNPVYHQYMGIATGNIAYNLYLRGKFEDAIPLFKIDKRIALEYRDSGLAAGSAIPLADIYIRQNHLDSAWMEIADAREFIAISGQTKRLRFLYPVMSKWYSKKGDIETAHAYIDSGMTAMKKYYEDKTALQLLRSTQRAEIEKKKIELGELENKKDRKIFFRNLIIISFAFVFILATVFFYSKYRQQQEIQELKIQEAKTELARAHDQLVDFSKRIAEKNELIEKLEIQSQQAENSELLSALKQSAILTEDDWKNFKIAFEKVYPLFFHRLKEKYAELSPAEIRYIALNKLDLSSGEIANCLGVSKKSLHVTWHRLRKKLDLPDTQTPQDIVRNIA